MWNDPSPLSRNIQAAIETTGELQAPFRAKRLARIGLLSIVLILAVPFGALVYSTFFTPSAPPDPCLHTRCAVLLDRSAGSDIYAKLSTSRFAALWLTWQERCPSSNIVNNLGVTVSGASATWRHSWQIQAHLGAGEAEIPLNGSRSVSVDVLPQSNDDTFWAAPTCRVHTRLLGVPKRG